MLRDVVLANVGNIIEVYEYCLYGFLAPIISQVFFPTGSKAASLTLTFGVFASGYLLRPLGALILGHIGDRYGRRNALLLSAVAIGISTLAMGLLPGYRSFGLLAPLLLTLCRMAQGIFYSGEYTGAMVYSMEWAPPHLRSTYSSLVNSVGNLGMIFCVITVILIYRTPLPFQLHYGWRLGYFFAGGAGFIVYLLRFSLFESPEYTKLLIKTENLISPLRALFRSHLPKLLLAISLLIMSAVSFYLLTIYLPTYFIQTIGLTSSFAMQLSLCGVVLMLFAIPVFAFIADRIGVMKVFIFATLAFMLLGIPLFNLLLNHHHQYLLSAIIVLFLISSACQASLPTVITHIFPTSCRYSGVSLSYNIAFALFGGTAPIIAEALINSTHVMVAPGWLISGSAGLVFLSILICYLRDTFPC